MRQLVVMTNQRQLAMNNETTSSDDQPETAGYNQWDN